MNVFLVTMRNENNKTLFSSGQFPHDVAKNAYSYPDARPFQETFHSPDSKGHHAIAAAQSITVVFTL